MLLLFLPVLVQTINSPVDICRLNNTCEYLQKLTSLIDRLIFVVRCDKHATFALFYNLLLHFILKINLNFGVSGDICGKAFVHFLKKANQHLIIESRRNLNIGLFISRMDYSINERNQFAINKFIVR